MSIVVFKYFCYCILLLVGMTGLSAIMIYWLKMIGWLEAKPEKENENDS